MLYIYISGGQWWAVGGGRWTVEPNQFCWWARAKMTVLKYPDSRPGHHLMSPTTWVTTFNWSPYIQLQNSKLNLSNFRVTSTFNKEINYACISWHSSLEWINETKKIAKLNINIKNSKSGTIITIIMIIIIFVVIIIIIIKLYWIQYDENLILKIIFYWLII